MNVRLLAPAQQELDEAIAWYSAQVPGLGDDFLDETLNALRLITRFPLAWHPLGQNVRRCRLKRFPYSVIYSVHDAELLVIAIAHQHRKPVYWRDRLSAG